MVRWFAKTRSVQGVAQVFSWLIEASGGPVENVETDTTRRPFEGCNRRASFDFEFALA